MVSGNNITGFFKWEPTNPALYDLEIELSNGDHVKTYFGMRKIEARDGFIFLNNHPLYQRLILDQGYWDESLLTPPSDEALKADIEWTKKFGYNGARKHQKLEDPRYYYWADKMGLIVWGEIPSTYEFTQDSVHNLSETLHGFIERDFNHPSIITWVPLNESWGVDRILTDKRMQMASEMLYCEAKALDGTRLVSVNDGWEQTRTDIYGLHDYAAYGDMLYAHFADAHTLEKGATTIASAARRAIPAERTRRFWLPNTAESHLRTATRNPGAITTRCPASNPSSSAMRRSRRRCLKFRVARAIAIRS